MAEIYFKISPKKQGRDRGRMEEKNEEMEKKKKILRDRYAPKNTQYQTT